MKHKKTKFKSWKEQVELNKIFGKDYKNIIKEAKGGKEK